MRHDTDSILSDYWCLVSIPIVYRKLYQRTVNTCFCSVLSCVELCVCVRAWVNECAVRVLCVIECESSIVIVCTKYPSINLGIVRRQTPSILCFVDFDWRHDWLTDWLTRIVFDIACHGIYILQLHTRISVLGTSTDSGENFSLLFCHLVATIPHRRCWDCQQTATHRRPSNTSVQHASGYV